MDFARAFTYPFEDPDWLKKIGLVALVSLIPIVGVFVLMGWTLDITRRVIGEAVRPLPDLDFGKQLGDGFKLFVVVLAYLIPVWVMLLPIIGVSAFLNEDSSGMEAIFGAVLFCCNGLIILYSFAMAFVLPAAYSTLAVTDSISAALRISDVLAMVRANPGAYLLVFLGTMLASIVAQLGVIACAIGVIFTMAYSMAVNGHLYGQAHKEANQNRGMARVY